MDELTLSIDKVVAGGAGLGFAAGEAVFVPFAAPGDRLTVSVTKRAKGYCHGEIKEVLTPGPDRVEQECPVYGLCGGCQLRHISPAAQARIKTDIVKESLKRIAKIDPDGVVTDIKAPPSAAGYRRRAGFKVKVVKRGVLMGFFAAQSHRVVDIAACPILDPHVSALIPHLKNLVASLDGGGRIPEIECVTGDSGIGLIIHTLRPFSRKDRERLAAFATDHEVAQLWVQRGRKVLRRSLFEKGALQYEVAGYGLGFSALDFIQVNGEGNRILVAEAMAAASGDGESSNGVAWDLFCGVGNFTLPLAGRFAEVRGVESLAASLKRLRDNAARNRLDNITTLQADLYKKEGLERLKELEQADLLLLDPPRTGAVELARHIAADPPKQVVYVSCDPATFARDAAILSKSDLDLVRVAPVDLFPQTGHVELVGAFQAG